MSLDLGLDSMVEPSSGWTPPAPSPGLKIEPWKWGVLGSSPPCAQQVTELAMGQTSLSPKYSTGLLLGGKNRKSLSATYASSDLEEKLG